MLKRTCAIALAAMLSLAFASGRGEPGDKNPDEKAQVQTLEALAAAFNKGDAKALATLWAETGILVSGDSGDRLKGRAAVESEYAAQLARAKGIHMALALETIRPITADVAAVEGTARFVKVGETPVERPFSAILVKKEGKWLIDSLR